MRIFLSVVLGVVMGILLFFLMHTLIAGKDGYDKPDDSGQVVDFIRVRRDELEQIKERTPPKKPPPPKEPPPPPKLKVASQKKPPPMQMRMEMPSLSANIAGQGPYLGTWSPGDPAAEGEAVPIVRIQPQYPREALINGYEGWVQLEFTILEDGSVDDVQVIDSEPRRMFDRNAVRALYRWKFKPKIVDGQAVRRRASQRIVFSLSGDDE